MVSNKAWVLLSGLDFVMLFCVAYTKCIAALCYDLIYLFIHLFICLFVYESRAPVTWSSVYGAIVLLVRVIFSSDRITS